MIDSRLLNVPTSTMIEEEEGKKAVWKKLRGSKHSLSGMVLDLSFFLLEEAKVTAQKWGTEIGVAIKIRKDHGGCFLVSVPVQKPSY